MHNRHQLKWCPWAWVHHFVFYSVQYYLHALAGEKNVVSSMNGSLTLELKDLSGYVCMTKYSTTQKYTSSKCDISKMEKDLTELAQSSDQPPLPCCSAKLLNSDRAVLTQLYLSWFLCQPSMTLTEFNSKGIYMMLSQKDP